MVKLNVLGLTPLYNHRDGVQQYLENSVEYLKKLATDLSGDGSIGNPVVEYLITEAADFLVHEEERGKSISNGKLDPFRVLEDIDYFRSVKTALENKRGHSVLVKSIDDKGISPGPTIGKDSYARAIEWGIVVDRGDVLVLEDHGIRINTGGSYRRLVISPETPKIKVDENLKISKDEPIWIGESAKELIEYYQNLL